MEGKNGEILELQQRLKQQEEEHGATVTAFEATIAEMNQAVAQHDEQWKEFLRSQTASFESEKVAIQENVNRLTEVVEVLKQQQQEYEKPREDETRSPVDGEIQQAEVARVLEENCNILASEVALLSVRVCLFSVLNGESIHVLSAIIGRFPITGLPFISAIRNSIDLTEVYSHDL